MVLDTSAIAAVLFQEPEARAISEAMEGDPVRLISAANWLEAQLVIHGRLGAQGGQMLEAFFRELAVETVALDRIHVQTALAAWQRFGKGRHPASLNLGDCCAYATALLQNQRLLCKGDDFSKTDISRITY